MRHKSRCRGAKLEWQALKGLIDMGQVIHDRRSTPSSRQGETSEATPTKEK